MMIEGSGSGSRAGSGSESIPLTSGSGSGSRRPKNMWIRIRIRNTAFKSVSICERLPINQLKKLGRCRYQCKQYTRKLLPAICETILLQFVAPTVRLSGFKRILGAMILCDYTYCTLMRLEVHHTTFQTTPYRCQRI